MNVTKQDQQEDAENRKYSFLVEWYDPAAALVRHYVLNYYDFDDSVEMVPVPVFFTS